VDFFVQCCFSLSRGTPERFSPHPFSDPVQNRIEFLFVQWKSPEWSNNGLEPTQCPGFFAIAKAKSATLHIVLRFFEATLVRFFFPRRSQPAPSQVLYSTLELVPLARDVGDVAFPTYFSFSTTLSTTRLPFSLPARFSAWLGSFTYTGRISGLADFGALFFFRLNPFFSLTAG